MYKYHWKKYVYCWYFGWCLRGTFNSDICEKLWPPPLHIGYFRLFWISDIFEKSWPPPSLGAISYIFEIENILMAVDPSDRHLNWHICSEKDEIHWKNTAKGNMSSAVCLPVGKTLLMGNFTHNHPPPISHLPLKVVFHQRYSSIEDRLLSEVVFDWRSSSLKGCLPSKVVFHQRSSSIEGRLPSMVFSQWFSSSIEGRLP